MGEHGNSPARNYSWEPFKPGHEVNLTHGARTKRPDVLAEQFYLRLMADESTPAYLHDPSYEEAIRAYCRSLAIVRLLWDWFDRQDIDVAMADVSQEDEDEERAYTRDEDGEGGGSRRRTTRRTIGRHVASVLDQLHRHETRAMSLRTKLGLDPLARTKMQRDVAGTKFDLARAIAELTEREQSA
jgi:hypothetical protein